MPPPRLGPDVGLIARSDEDLFVFSSDEMGPIGSDYFKGISYQVPDDGIARERLDDVGALPPDMYHRKIAPGWYVFYEYQD